MSKVSYSGKDHGNAVLVTFFNTFFITDGATRLDYGRDTVTGRHFYCIFKGEKGI